MDRERYARIQAVVVDAIRLPESVRNEFVADACAGDDELRSEVASLLALESRDDALGETAIEGARRAIDDYLAESDGARPVDAEFRSDGMPLRIGPYRILRRVGAGGMGVVFEARQESPRRRVALKVLQSFSASDEIRRRFRLEAELLGRLQHPNIAQIFESGTYDLGRGPQPFFALEFVSGVDLRTYAARARLDERNVLRLLARVCSAVHHAHERGIVHRDLKPENVLVDSEGVPKVLDFGVARASDRGTILSTLVTAQGELLGTLGYMAPEQLSGSPDAITPATDVYALGILAYEILCGRQPHALAGLPLSRAIRIVTGEDAPRLAIVDPRLRGDIDSIVGKAIEKNPARRYPSAAALRDDIERFLDRLPVRARPPSRIYRMRRYVARKKAFVFGLSGTIATLVAGLGVSLVLLADTREARDATRRRLYAAEMREAGNATTNLSGCGTVRAFLSHWDRPGNAEDLRGWEWHWLRSMAAAEERIVPIPDVPLSLAWLSGGERLAVGMEGGIDIVDPRTGDPTEGRVIPVPECRVRPVLEMPGSGLLLAGATIGTERAPPRFEARDPATGDLLFTFGPESLGGAAKMGICRGAIDRNGDRIAFEDYTGTVQIWDVRARRLLRTIPEAKGESESFDPTGRYLTTGGARGSSVRIWDTTTWQMVRELPCGEFVRWLDWSSDGRRLVTAAGCDAIVWNVDTGSVVRRLVGHQHYVRVVQYSPNGRWIASAGQDRAVLVWDAETGERVRTRLGHEGFVTSLAWHPDSRSLATASEGDRTVRIWSMASNEARSSWPTGWDPSGVSFQYAADIAFGADRNSVRVLYDGTTRTFSSETGELMREETGYVRDAPNGALVAWASRAEVTLTHAASQEVVARLDCGGSDACFAACAPIGAAVVVILSKDNVFRQVVWNSASPFGNDAKEFERQQGNPVRPVWHPSGDKLAFVREASQIGILDARTLEVERLVRLPQSIHCLAYSPDGSLLAVSDRSVDMRVRLFAMEDMIEKAGLIGHSFLVNSMAFSPDGARVASGSSDGTIRVWDPRSSETLLALRHEPGVLRVAWSPDGRRLASLNADMRVELFDASRSLKKDAEESR